MLDQAEAIEASKKAADKINASLMDAICYNKTDYALLQAKWESQIIGERSRVCSPSPLELPERSSCRQIGQAHYFIGE